MAENYIGLKGEEDKVTSSQTDYSLLDNEIFFNAKKAKEKMILTRKKITESQLLPVYSEINKAINNGMTYVDGVWIKKDTGVKEFLMKNGFTISVQTSNNNDIKIKITWA
jgi:hypothetical protein